MSIATAIQNAQVKVAAAYTSCNNKRAIMPASGSQNLTNLASTIDTIYAGYPFNQTIQKVIVTEEEGVKTYTRDEEFVGIITGIVRDKYKNDTALVAALIPDTVTYTGAYAFQDCTNLRFVNLENVTHIDSYSFSGCTSLENLHFSDGIITIKDHAFENTPELKIDLDLPATVTTLESASFHESGIRTAKLRNSSFSSDATFTGCVNLVSVDMTESTITTTGYVYAESRGTFAGCTSLKTVALPTTCIEIGRASFYGDTSLETITGMGNVTAVRNNAFRNCSSLKNIDLSNVSTIETFAFGGSGLTTIELPLITSIPGSAYGGGPFFNCGSLTYVDIGNACTSVGERAFGQCVSLEKFIIRATTPPEAGVNIFHNIPNSFKIYVPYSADHSILTAYQNATNWNTYAANMMELNSDGTIPV